MKREYPIINNVRHVRIDGKLISVDSLLEKWNNATGPKEVAQAFGIDYKSLKNQVSHLRRSRYKYPFKTFQVGGKVKTGPKEDYKVYDPILKTSIDLVSEYLKIGVEIQPKTQLNQLHSLAVKMIIYLARTFGDIPVTAFKDFLGTDYFKRIANYCDEIYNLCENDKKFEENLEKLGKILERMAIPEERKIKNSKTSKAINGHSFS